MRNELKSKIEAVLRDVPETRNDDVLLTITIWKKYHSSYIFQFTPDQRGPGDYVNLLAIRYLPREDHIKRIRAKIQNEEFRFLPTRIEVARQRKINEERWYQAMRKPDTL